MTHVLQVHEAIAPMIVAMLIMGGIQLLNTLISAATHRNVTDSNAVQSLENAMFGFANMLMSEGQWPTSSDAWIMLVMKSLYDAGMVKDPTKPTADEAAMAKRIYNAMNAAKR